MVTKWMMYEGREDRSKSGSEAAGRNDEFISNYLGDYVVYILSKESLQNANHMYSI